MREVETPPETLRRRWQEGAPMRLNARGASWVTSYSNRLYFEYMLARHLCAAPHGEETPETEEVGGVKIVPGRAEATPLQRRRTKTSLHMR